MSDNNLNDSFVDMFIFETTQNLEQLEQLILSSESDSYSEDELNEIFRIMHTIKGSSAMMSFNDISSLAHKVEDLFFKIRENKTLKYNRAQLSDLVLGVVDFLKVELEKIKAGEQPDGVSQQLIEEIHNYLKSLENSDNKKEEVSSTNTEQEFFKDDNDNSLNKFEATIFFEDGCMMENIRAFGVIHKLKDYAAEIRHIPQELVEDDTSTDIIKKDGFKIFIKTDKSYDEINKILLQTLFLKDLTINQIVNEKAEQKTEKEENGSKTAKAPEHEKSNGDVHVTTTSIISVNVTKLDKLLDLAGEIVTAEAMITHNPDLKGLELPNFKKTAQHFRKIIGELQDLIMSVRMVPLAVTFQKMNRIVYDMTRKLNKKANLVLVGEDTEVDKNIIEHLSDPLMHLVRNSIDHGLEMPEDRIKAGKPEAGTITLQAENDGSEVVIRIIDDGKGFDKNNILEHAKKKGLLHKPEEDYTDKEIYSLIFLPGFSTKDKITEFSGRGVGMDVVVKNIQAVGGVVSVDSQYGKGSVITIKIPLTLAIISGMNVAVGESIYTIPIKDIRETFRPKEDEIITDTNGNNMILVRGKCYPIIRLNKLFCIDAKKEELHEGILLMVEKEDHAACIFADELIGEQQMVVKPIPKYIKENDLLPSCTLLGDGSISLILDIGMLLSKSIK